MPQSQRPTSSCTLMGTLVRFSTRVPYLPSVFSTTQKSNPGMTTSFQRSPIPRSATSSMVTIRSPKGSLLSSVMAPKNS